MVTNDAQTVDDYIASLPEDRRAAVEAVREVVRRNLPAGYEEGDAVRDDRLVRAARRTRSAGSGDGP